MGKVAHGREGITKDFWRETDHCNESLSLIAFHGCIWMGLWGEKLIVSIVPVIHANYLRVSTPMYSI
jgi:hypothetical protein